MSMTPGGITRTVALWVLILSAAFADVILWVQGQVVWAVFVAVIYALVIGFEIYGYFFSKEKKTISNMYKAWIQKSPFWAYTTLALLCLAFNALILHLAVW